MLRTTSLALLLALFPALLLPPELAGTICLRRGFAASFGPRSAELARACPCCRNETPARKANLAPLRTEDCCIRFGTPEAAPALAPEVAVWSPPPSAPLVPAMLGVFAERVVAVFAGPARPRPPPRNPPLLV